MLNNINKNYHENRMPIYFGFKALGALIGNYFGGRLLKVSKIK